MNFGVPSANLFHLLLLLSSLPAAGGFIIIHPRCHYDGRTAIINQSPKDDDVDGAASSKEEDLILTLKVIMDHAEIMEEVVKNIEKSLEKEEHVETTTGFEPLIEATATDDAEDESIIGRYEEELAANVESNRRLEDRYEWEQNAKMSTIRELDSTKASLDTLEKKLAETEEILSKVRGELRTTTKKYESEQIAKVGKMKELETTEKALATLQRKLGKTERELIEVRGELASEQSARAKIRQELMRVKGDLTLEETSKAAKIRELSDAMDSLEKAQKKISNNERELSQLQSELGITSANLKTISSSLDQLRQESESVRKLGKKIWSLTKNRVQNRILKVRKENKDDCEDD